MRPLRRNNRDLNSNGQIIKPCCGDARFPRRTASTAEAAGPATSRSDAGPTVECVVHGLIMNAVLNSDLAISEVQMSGPVRPVAPRTQKPSG